MQSNQSQPDPLLQSFYKRVEELKQREKTVHNRLNSIRLTALIQGMAISTLIFLGLGAAYFAYWSTVTTNPNVVENASCGTE